MTYNRFEKETRSEQDETQSKQEIIAKNEENFGRNLTTNLVAIVGNIRNTQDFLALAVMVTYTVLIAFAIKYIIAQISEAPWLK